MNAFSTPSPIWRTVFLPHSSRLSTCPYFGSPTDQRVQASEGCSGTVQSVARASGRVWVAKAEPPTVQPAGSQLLEDLSRGDRLRGIVTHESGANSLWLDVKVVRRGRKGTFKPVTARLRWDSVVDKGEQGDMPSTVRYVQPKEKVGRKLNVKVKRADVASGRLEVARLQSASRNAKRARHKPPPLPPDGGIPISSLTCREQLSGKIAFLTRAGAFVDCGVSRPGKKGTTVGVLGFLKRDRFLGTWRSEADLVSKETEVQTLKVGDEITVYVVSAHPENGFLWLSGEPIDEEAYRMRKEKFRARQRRRKRRSRMETLTIGDTLAGTVCEAAEFGFFVDVGVNKDGLVHKTAIPMEYKENWESLFEVGDMVVVNVLSVEEGRISLELVDMLESIRKEVEMEAASPTATQLTVERLALLKQAKPGTVLGGDGQEYTPRALQTVSSASRRSAVADEYMEATKSASAASALQERTVDRDPKSPGRDVGNEAKGEGTSEIDDDDDDDDDDLDDRFSDDYFEDKYGGI